MSDDQQNNQGTGGSTATVVGSNTDVKVDKSKSPEQYITEVESKYIVPPLVRDKFTDLVKLIYETESMDAEEREYWLQIMPIMSEDQVVKLRDILVNEKVQLEKLDQNYKSEVSNIGNRVVPEIDEQQMKEKMAQIKSAESASEQSEQAEEDALLKQLNDL